MCRSPAPEWRGPSARCIPTHDDSQLPVPSADVYSGSHPCRSVVRPDQVLSGGGPGEVLLIADCQAAEQAVLLRQHPKLLERTADGALHPLSAVIHLSPPPVVASAEYVSWCASLPGSSRQYFVDLTPQRQRLAFVASARLQLKLHALHGLLFPKPCAAPLLFEGGLAPGLPPLALSLDMHAKLLFRPKEKAGVDRQVRAASLSLNPSPSLILTRSGTHSHPTPKPHKPTPKPHNPTPYQQPPALGAMAW